MSIVLSPDISLALLNSRCLLFNSLSIDAKLLLISFASKFVIVPTRCGSFIPVLGFSNAPANPPPFYSIKLH